MTNLEKAEAQALKEVDFTNTVQAKTAWKMGWDAAVETLTRNHVFWGAGEKDCPRDIKAPNGELHTLRCKVCGSEGSRGICLGDDVKECSECDGIGCLACEDGVSTPDPVREAATALENENA